MNMDLATTLAQLVSTPSVNPMGKPAGADEPFESRITDKLETWFRSLGLPFQRQTIEPSRDNIIARLDGHEAGPIILFDAHQDTVPVDGMTIDPFAATISAARAKGSAKIVCEKRINRRNRAIGPL